MCLQMIPIIPRIGPVATGSDFAHFYYYGAIPIVDIMHGIQDIVSYGLLITYFLFNGDP